MHYPFRFSTNYYSGVHFHDANKWFPKISKQHFYVLNWNFRFYFYRLKYCFGLQIYLFNFVLDSTMFGITISLAIKIDYNNITYTMYVFRVILFDFNENHDALRHTNSFVRVKKTKRLLYGSWITLRKIVASTLDAVWSLNYKKIQRIL